MSDVRCGTVGSRWVGTSGAYALYECPTCAFVSAPAVRPAQVEAAYRNGQSAVANGAPNNGQADDLRFLAPAFERLMDERLSASAAAGASGGDASLHALDFGCGQSRVPHLLRERGHRVVGVDLLPPDPSLGPPHEDRLTGDLLRVGLEGDQFDLAYAFQVFEHLPEPRPVLDELLRLVRPGGLVLIHTDMETKERLAAERNGGLADWWYVMPPNHCSYYRLRTFERALEGRGAHLEWSDEKSALIRVGGPSSP